MKPPIPLEACFFAALEKGSPEERAAYLDEACAGDLDFRRQVEKMLAAHAVAGSFLESPVKNEVVTVDLPVTEPVGTVIGAYKLLEQIGEGGMGSVWMAQQTEPVKRLVAVKLIKAGMDSKQVIARFEAERQALALMDHPNIARVLDAGATGAGRPYFVMDLVKGVPITRYCDEHHLTPRQRLDLFVPVCQAVQHAHQKGIIHRDLKPSNVLVALYDGRPVPKVIDFGVAKAAGHQLTDKTLVTGFGAIVGTLEYMSPEQAEVNQLDIDTRSDIYALGVLLYELLAGSPPFSRKELEKAGMLEMLRVIREQEPSKPSTKLSTAEGLPTLAANRGTEPGKLTRLIRGELDWIVMKALEKDRNRRYETANGFAMDVQRYLAGEPVLAAPASQWYRLRKFARRNQGRLAMAALGLFFLTSLVAVAGWAAMQRAKQQAALETDIGRDLDEARAFCRADRLREASAVLDHAQALAERGAADGDLGGRVAQLRKDVDMAARVEAIRVETAWTKDGHLLDWEVTARRYTDAFRDYGLDLDQLEPDQAAARIQVSAIRQQLVAALDDRLWAMSRRDQERLLAVLVRADADPWRQQLRVVFVNRTLKTLRELAREANAPTQPPADAVLLGGMLHSLGDKELAVEFLRRAQQEHPSDYWLNQELGQSLMHLKSPRAAAEAVGYFRAALALRPDSAVSHVSLAKALVFDGDLRGAVAACQKAVALKPDFATAHNDLGFALLALGDLPGARAALQRVIALEPDLPEGQWNMGNVLRRQGDLPGAVAAYRKATALKPDDAVAHCSLGNVLQQQGDLPGAVAAYRKAIALKPDYAEFHTNLANVLQQQGDLPGAVAAYRKAIALKPEDATAHNQLAIALALQRDLLGAIAEYQKAIVLRPDFAGAHYNLGMTLRDQGDLPGAIAAYQKAIALKPDHAMAHNNLGVALRDQGDLLGAIAEYQKAIALKPDSAEAHCNLGIVLRQQGEFAKALEELSRGHELGSKDPDWRQPSARWVRECQRLIELDGRLVDILAGKAAPASAAERIDLAQLCALRQRNRAALRFYEEAFAAQAALLAVHRYNAACAAALAGCGRGKDADKLGDEERARLRSLARDWLYADLESLGRLLDKEPARAAASVAKSLQHWLVDSDFGGVRGAVALAELPEAERPAWQKLWKDVGDMLKQAQGKAAPHEK